MVVFGGVHLPTVHSQGHLFFKLGGADGCANIFHFKSATNICNISFLEKFFPNGNGTHYLPKSPIVISWDILLPLVFRYGAELLFISSCLNNIYQLFIYIVIGDAESQEFKSFTLAVFEKTRPANPAFDVGKPPPSPIDYLNNFKPSFTDQLEKLLVDDNLLFGKHLAKNADPQLDVDEILDVDSELMVRYLKETYDLVYEWLLLVVSSKDDR